ncbi:MBOAT, membrane-bound O-acyltransferase family-domain-containing protein [Cladochytrium replicatum]|nr:MBOAT, membrane-bound O-acyltransferase family-domain-containing protein [Cladochytrium replicatum]
MIDALLDPILAATGMPADTLKAAFLMLFLYPSAAVFNLIPRRFRALRHAFSIVLSVSLYTSMFPLPGFAQLVAQTVVVYLLAWAARGQKWMPVVVFFGALGHLSANFVWTQLLYPDVSVRFDHTSPMMVLVIKTTSFAWSVHDGTRRKDRLTQDEKDLAIKSFPGLLEYLGYVFFFPTFLAGPALNFRDYQMFIDSEAPMDRIPSVVIPTIKQLGLGLILSAVYAVFSSRFNYWFCLTDTYLNQWSFWKRVAFVQAAALLTKAQYYAGWKLAEGACTMVGVSYNGVDEKGREKWDRVINIDIRRCEFAQSPKEVTDHWNIRTTLWLRRCVYNRVGGSRSLAKLLTYVVSAFWHGFYPGYYFAFVLGALSNVAGGHLRRSLRPLFAQDKSKLRVFKPIYDFLGWVGTYLTVSMMGMTFTVASWNNSIVTTGALYWKSWAFYAVVLVLWSWPFRLDRVIRAIYPLFGVTHVERKHRLHVNPEVLDGDANGAAEGVDQVARQVAAPQEGHAEKHHGWGHMEDKLQKQEEDKLDKGMKRRRKSSRQEHVPQRKTTQR